MEMKSDASYPFLVSDAGSSTPNKTVRKESQAINPNSLRAIRKTCPPHYSKSFTLSKESSVYDMKVKSSNCRNRYPKVPHFLSSKEKIEFHSCEVKSASFIERRMATIREEPCSIAMHSFENRIRKMYDDKLASKVQVQKVAGILHKMCLEKPEVLQNVIPDETIELFQAVHI